MKTSYKIPIIVIPTILVLSFFVISFDTGLGDADDTLQSNVTMQFSDFADNFSTCSSATFKHTMITDDGYPIYVIANITDDCKIHVIHDNREDKNTDVAHRKLIEAECDKLKLEDDFIDFENCIISENESGSFRVWKK